MGNCFITRRGGNAPQGFFPSLFVTGLTEQDTCTATCNGKTFNGVWTSKGRLPSEYQEVEYIETDGNSYIDTGLSYNGAYLKAEILAQLPSHSSSTSEYWFGHSESSGANSFASFVSSNKIGAYIASTSNPAMPNYAPNSDLEFVMEHNGASYTFKVNGSNVQLNGHIATLNVDSLRIGSANYQSNLANTVFKSVKLYSDSSDNLVRDFVPCYRKSDNVIGMYDTVNDVFYTNAGSGSFTKGADINQSGFLFSNLTELGTYIVSNGTSTMAILIDAPIEYTLEWSTIPRNGLVAEYLFDGDTLDTSPNGNDLTNSGITFSNNTGVFSGSAYAQASSKVLPENSPYSISVWFKKSGTGYDYLFDTINGNSTNKGISIQFKQSGQIQARIDDSNTSTEYQVASQNNVNDGIWHHLVFTWTGTTENNGMKLYIDGVLDAQATSGFNASTHTYDLTIGKPNNLAQYYLNGALDNIRIYDRVLTEDEIKALYGENAPT